MVDVLIEFPTMCQFAGIDWISDRIPDESMLLAFLHLLKPNIIGENIYCFAEDFFSGTL
jgi:IS5 family transposase